jgi:competence protein ComEA
MKPLLLFIFSLFLLSFQPLSFANDIAKEEVNKPITMQLNINTATVEQLATLKGIGTKKAQSIVQYRETNGNYQSVDGLLNVKGIGEKVLLDNKTKLSI